MKIEKGKLYYDTVKKEVLKADDTVFFNDVGNEFTNKIAVNCPFKEDYDYVRNIFGDINHDRPFVYINENYGVRHGPQDYHIITIDQFKEFYPESEAITNKTSTIIQNKEQTISEQLKYVIEELEKLKEHVNKIKSRL